MGRLLWANRPSPHGHQCEAFSKDVADYLTLAIHDGVEWLAFFGCERPQWHTPMSALDADAQLANLLAAIPSKKPHEANVIDLPDELAEQFPTSMQARLIVRELATRLGRWVRWSELPDDAFQARNNRLPDAVMKALKRIRDQFNQTADYELSISEIEQTAKLTPTKKKDK